MYNLPSIISRKFTYANNPALLRSFENWKAFEKSRHDHTFNISPDLEAEAHSHTKTVTAAFPLSDRETQRELNVLISDRFLPFFPTLTCRLKMKCFCQNTAQSCPISAEHCEPVPCRSAHTRLIDSVLNDALHSVTERLLPTPTDHLTILSGIQLAELCRLGATISLANSWSLTIC